MAPGGKNPSWMKVVLEPPSKSALIGVDVETCCIYLMMTREQGRRSMSFLCSSLLSIDSCCENCEQKEVRSESRLHKKQFV